MQYWMVFWDILKKLRVPAQVNWQLFLWIWCSRTRRVIQLTMSLHGNMTMMIIFLKSCKIWREPIFMTMPQQPVVTLHVPISPPPTIEGVHILHEQSQPLIYDGSLTCMLEILALILKFQINFNISNTAISLTTSMSFNFFLPKHLNLVLLKNCVELKKFLRVVNLALFTFIVALEIIFFIMIKTRCRIIAQHAKKADIDKTQKVF